MSNLLVRGLPRDSVRSAAPRLQTPVHPEQNFLRFLLEIDVYTGRRRAGAAAEIHVVVFDEARPVRREFVFEAGADVIAALVVGELPGFGAAGVGDIDVHSGPGPAALNVE